METLTIRQARRLALARAGLMAPRFTGLPDRGSGRGARSRAHAVIGRFGYLQLDTISVAGARSHGIVLASRLDGLDASLAESLLLPGEPLFEYWGHEACWMPLELYPCFGFRRREFAVHPWWGDLLGEHRALARGIRRRIETEGPLRSVDLEGRSGPGWWDIKLTKRLAEAMWSSGELAIRERRGFQRSYDLAERVVPAELREHRLGEEEALDTLLLRALHGHGWASAGTLAATWRLVNRREAVRDSLERLAAAGRVAPCALETGERTIGGWVRPGDLELLPELDRARPRRDRGVLLSPFDPVLWDRVRTQLLFGFEQVLEVYKPEPRRRYGYYCMPVLAGEHLVARVDLKADRGAGILAVRACHLEEGAGPRERRAVATAIERFARAVDLETPREAL